jgi:murein DD-endopeptidase MepM/ murein hydrolase activator NlpD
MRQAKTALTVVWLISAPVLAAKKDEPTVSAAPGTLVRWSAPGTKRCGMSERSWPPLEETCYYPIDLLQKPGTTIRITRWGKGKAESARISVEPYPYETQEVDLPNIPQANPSPEEFQRNAREQAELSKKVWKRREAPVEFELPLGAPLKPLPEGRAFGVKRVFNGKPATQPHMGTDYAAPAGTPVLAVADGTVVFAEDLFFPGEAVFIDHGDGLISMSFHLSEIRVKEGDSVARGDTIGLVGTTGRSTGPHLYLGFRWHGARIDPHLLLEDPAKIPAVGP